MQDGSCSRQSRSRVPWKAQSRMNQVEFTLDGRPYTLLTGDPMLFGSVKIWMKHYGSIKDADPTSPGENWSTENPALAFGQLKNLAANK